MQRRRHKFTIVNVVGTADTRQTLNLKQVCMATKGKLGMGVFPSAISKSKFPRSTNCAFETGKLVNTGSRSVLEALLSLRKYCDCLTDVLGVPHNYYDYNVQNIVGALRVGYRLNLNMLYDDRIKLRRQDCKWEPDSFRGLKLETAHPDITMIIFETGKIIVTGPATFDRIALAEQLLYDLNIERYEEGREYRSTSDVRVIAQPRGEKKKKKPNQFKVINHTKKKEEFQAVMMMSTKKNAKRKPANKCGGDTTRRRVCTASSSSIQYPH